MRPFALEIDTARDYRLERFLKVLRVLRFLECDKKTLVSHCSILGSKVRPVAVRSEKLEVRNGGAAHNLYSDAIMVSSRQYAVCRQVHGKVHGSKVHRFSLRITKI